jgi:autotransporter-associated beta strand protein
MKIKSICAKPLCLIASLLLLAGGVSVQAQATSYTWSAAAGSADWTTAANWSPNTGFPSVAGDVATITSATTLTASDIITLAAPVMVGAITIGGAGTSAFSYTLGANGGNAITLNNNGAVATITIVGNAQPDTIAAPLIIADAGGLTITNNGAQSRAQLVSGGITGTGNLTIGDGRAGGTSSSLTYSTGAINNSGTLTVNSSQSGTSIAIATALNCVIGTNVTTFTKIGPETNTLGAVNLYTGATIISAGTIQLGVANAIPRTSSVSIASGAILNLRGYGGTIGALTGAGWVTNSTATVVTLNIGNNNSDGTFSGIIGTTAGTNISLTKSGSGTEVLSGANIYRGTTTIGGGILNAGILENAGISGPFGMSAAANPGSIVFSGGTLQYSSANNNDYSGRFSTAAGQNISIGLNGQSVAFATALTSSGGSLTITNSTGTGTLTLNNTETYSGATTINGGTLALGASGALASSSSVSIGAGGTFDVSALASPYNFGSSATLTASGTGTSSTTEADIVAGSSGTFSLGTRPVNLTWSGSSGDSTTPCLNISQGTLAFNGNTITVSGPVGGLGAGTYTLIATSGAGALSGTAPVVSVTALDLAAGCAVTGTTLTSSSLTITIAPEGAVGTWNGPASGNWSAAGNWTAAQGTMPPHVAGDSAIFGTGSSPVIFDAGASGYSVGAITFNTATAFTISGSPTLTLDNKGSGALIIATSAAGSPTVISTPLSLNDNATLTVASGTTLDLSGVVSSTSITKTLAVNGAGTTILSAVNNYGPSTGSVGTALSGGGTLQLGNNGALGAGDVSVSGNSIIQAGAAGLNVGNNIAIADTTTVDNSGNNLTLGGVISGAGGISKIKNGTLTLNGNNTYSGSTMIANGALSIASDSNLGTAPGSATANSLVLGSSTSDLLLTGNATLNATRGVGIGATSGSTGSTALIDVASGQTAVIGGNIASAGNTGANGLTINSGPGNTGMLILGGTNTFKGTTVIAVGTLQLANGLALQGSTLNYSSGTLDFGSLTAATLGGLSGTQNLSLVNDSSAPLALTVGGNNASTSYSGNLSGPGSLTLNGTGTLTLGNANYTSNTVVNSTGVLTINSGSFGSSSSTITLGNGLGAATLNFSGNGTVAANTVNVAQPANSTGCNMTLTGGVSANFSTLNLGAAGDTFGNFTINTTGTIGLGAVTDYKDENGNGPAGTAAGLVISAGTVTASSLIVQGAASTGAATVNMRGGSLTISGSSGAFEMGNGASTRGGWLEMTGGTLTYLGTDGLLMGNTTTTGGGATISGGTAYLTGVTLNAINQINAAGLTNSLTLSNSATLYLGNVGLVINQPSATVSATLGYGGATVGALEGWSSIAPITLAGPTTFQAANASSTACNISLGGAISGTGPITKTGNGTLTLSGANSYTNGTIVSAGVLNINGVSALGDTNYGGLTLNGTTLQYASGSTGNGSLDLTSIGTSSVTIGPGADVIDVNGNNVSFANSIGNYGAGGLTVRSTAPGGVLNFNGTNTYAGNTTVAVGAALGGSGTISNTVEIQSGGILAPGNNTVGTLTVGVLKLDSGAIGSFEFNGVANDEVVATGGLTLNDPSDNVAFNLYQAGGTLGMTQPGTFNLIQYSGTAPVLGTSWTTTSGSNPHVANPQPSFLYSFHATGGYLVLKVSLNGTAVAGTWTNDVDGNWSTAANWDSNPNVPHSAGDLATFGAGTALRTVTLDANKTVGTLNLTNNNSFVIAGSGKTLTLDRNGFGANVYVPAGVTNQIKTAVSLNDNATFVVGSGKSLAISGNVGNAVGSAETLTLNSPGTLTLSGNNSYGPGSGSFGTYLTGGAILQMGSSAALGASDVSFTGNGTLQASVTGLSVANNIDIAPGVNATVDSSGNNLALNGVINDSGSLTKAGNGTLTLNGYNTYTGNTYINAGVLSISSYGNLAGMSPVILNGGDLLGNVGIDALYSNIGIGPTNGSVSGTGLIDAASGQVFTLEGSIASAGNTGTNNLVVNSGAGHNGTVYMIGDNTYRGTTTISNGWLELGSSGGLQNSTLNYINPGGHLIVDGVGAITLGGLTGAQDWSLVDDNSNPLALTVGGNNVTTTYTGNLSGTGSSLSKIGTGTLTLSNANYTGGTSVGSGGVLTISGGSFGGSSSTLQVGNVAQPSSVTAATLNISGGTNITAGLVDVGTVGNETGTALNISGTASVNFTTVQVGASGNASVSSINAPGQTESLGAVTLYKDANAGGPNTNATVLSIRGGTVNATSIVQANSSGSGTLNIAGGSLTIGNSSSSGAFKFGAGTTATRGGYVMVSSGSLTYLGTDGLLMGVAAATQPNAIAISGGAATLTGITLNSAGTAVSSSLTNTGTGTLYLGSLGLVNVSSNADATPVTLSGTSTLGAFADWSTSVPIFLTNTPTIQAADVSNVVHNITLSGVLSGTGVLTKTGNGILTLSGTNTYTGGMSISNGTLALSSSGSISNTAQVGIGAGATFDVSALGGYTFTGASPTQTMAGISTSGTANVNVTGNTLTLASGAKGLLNALGGNSPTNGKISVAGDLVLNTNAITINVNGGILGVGNYQLLGCTGTLTGSANSTPTFTGLGATPGAATSITTTTGTGGHVDLAIGKATPILETATASSILPGQALSSSTLSVIFTNAAGVAVPGTFAFSSPGTVPPVGTANQQVQYTPIDTTNYNTPAAFNVAVTVGSPVLIPTQSAGITGFSMENGNVVITGTNGQSGGTYYLLTSTNLAMPVSQWKAAATNVVGTNGANGSFTFTGTNAVGAGAGQSFYILSNTNN